MESKLTYEQKKSIYEAVMKNISKVVKKSLDNISTEEFTNDDTHYSFSFNRGLGVQKAIGAKRGPLGTDKTFAGNIYISGPDHDTVMLYIYSIIMTAQWKKWFNIKIDFACSKELNNELMQWRK